MDYFDVPFGDEVFTFIETDGTHRLFHVTALRNSKEVKRLPIRQFAITHEQFLFIMQKMGIEPHRVARLRGKENLDPILLADMEDGFMILINGSHRYVARYLDKHEFIDGKAIPKRIWEKHLITGIPKDAAEWSTTGYSGF